jgi:DNA polymerase III epsilon subunit-like protein
VEVYPALRQALHGKTWLIYSADFDVGRLRTSVSDWGFFSEFKHYFKQYPIKAADIYCMRDLYAAFCGEWHSYYKNYRWQKLTSAASGFGITSRKPAHSAIGDCLMTLDLLYAVADCYRNETL